MNWFTFVRNNIFYFSDTTALASGFVPNLMEVTQNVLRWGTKKIATKEVRITFSVYSTPTLINKVT